MTIFGALGSLYNAVILRIWPKPQLKRSRDSDDDEDDAIFAGCQTLAKRPKWMSTPYHSNLNMSSDGDQPRTEASGRLSRVLKKQFPQRQLAEAKENNPDVVEVVDLSDSNETLPTESRPPLSNLAVRPKTKSVPPPDIYRNGITQRIPERKPNGVNGGFNTFTTSLRMSKNPIPKMTALDETFMFADRMKYSQLLAEYHRGASKNAAATSSSSQQGSQASTDWPTLSSPSRSNSLPKSIGFIDLTGDEQRKTRIEVTPWLGGRSSSADDDVQIVEVRPTSRVERVNSLERKLSENSLVSPQWIIDLQKKYNEKARAIQRQLEEEQIKKDLYAKHNLEKHEALYERIKKHLKITDGLVLDDTEELVVPLPELTSEMVDKINRALKASPSSEVLVQGFGQRITRGDIQTLKGLNWLNDEVINFYMNLLIERGKEEKKLKVYAFNTFFYPKLVSQGYNSLRRWTKKVDVFAHELLLVPVHLGMHWCMAIIDFRDKMIRYYDSMGSENNRCLNALLRYLTEESMDKKKQPYDITDWKIENVKDIPQQMNGSDCGMFSCMFAEYISRSAKITFSQKDMPYFRRKMVYEIVTKKLLL